MIKKLKSYFGKIGDHVAKRPLLKAVVQILNETVAVFLLLILSSLFYYLLVKFFMLTSEDFFNNIKEIFKNFKVFVLAYLLISIAAVLTAFLKKYLLNRKYSLSTPTSREVSIMVYAEIITEKILLAVMISLLLFTLSKTGGTDLQTQLDFFSRGIYKAVLLLMILPFHSVIAALMNLVLVRSFIPSKYREKTGQTLRMELKFAFGFGAILPLVYVAIFLLIPKSGFSLFASAAKFFFG